jgi:hypothetical protein
MRQRGRWKRYLTAPLAAALGVAGLVAVRAELGTAATGDITMYVSGTDALGVAVDGSGNVFWADNGAVRMRTPGGATSTFAGTGTPGESGDGGPATTAQINMPTDIAFDGQGNVYILDQGFLVTHVVRKVTRSTNVISTVVDSTMLGNAVPTAMTVDSAGNVYVAAQFNPGGPFVAKFAPGASVADTVAGTGNVGDKGDGGAAINATFNGIKGLLVTPGGETLYIADSGNHRIRKVSGGIVTLFAGCDSCLPFPTDGIGDGNQATQAKIRGPEGMAFGPNGSIYLTDVLQFRIRRVSSSGVIDTIAGNGSDGSTGDGGPAVEARLDEPRSIAVNGGGDLFIADTASGSRSIRKVEGTGGISTTTTSSTSTTMKPEPPPPPPGKNPGEKYIGINPVRVLDTRPAPDNVGVRPGKITAGETVNLTVAGGSSPVPDGIRTVAINLTATNATATSYIAAWPAGEAQPWVSSLNLRPGETRANLVIAKVGANGQISLFNAAGAVDLIGDIVGFYQDDAKYVSLSPQRVFDTREGQGAPKAKIPAGNAVEVPVTGVGGVPFGAKAVVINLTGTNASTSTFVSALPTWTPGEVPGTSSINLVPGELAANLTIAKVSPTGTIRVYNGAGTTDAIGDVVGYFPADSDYVPMSPSRLLDTRDGIGIAPGKVPGGSKVDLDVLSQGLPGDSSQIAGVVLNVTVVNPTQDAFITVWPSGADMPLASSTNVRPSQVVANTVISKVGSNGKVSLYNSTGTVDLLADIVGWIPAN